MIEIWSVLAPILIADVLNPVLFAFMVYAAGTERPILNSCSVILGHTAAYFLGGIVLAVSLERISQRLANPHQIDFFISLTVGLLLLLVAIRLSKASVKQQAKEPETLTPLTAFAFGAVINFVGLPFALPYFAALDQILKADFSASEAILVLASYNVAYALPFLIVPILTSVLGARSRPILQRINEILDRLSGFLMPVLLALVGLALVVDALFYFITGEGLY